MGKFVYLVNEQHSPYRELTREIELSTEFCNVIYNPDAKISLEIFRDEKACAETLTKAQLNKFFFGEGAGLNLCSPRIVSRGIKYAGNRMHKGFNGYYPVASERIIYGIGLFRNARTEQSLYQALLGIPPEPLIDSSSVERVVYYERRKADPERLTFKEHNWYESTNIILADEYGELEQLFKRKNETLLMDRYLEDLQELPTKRIPINIPSYNLHLKRGLWQEPPKNRTEMIERIELILDNIYTDTNANLILTDYEHLDLCETINTTKSNHHATKLELITKEMLDNLNPEKQK